MATGTLHFRIGSEAGILLMNIAQEHLLDNLDPEKAIKVFTDSFGKDCTMEMKLKILKGDMVILVDEEDQMFNVVDREKHHENFPKLNIPNWYKRKHKEIGEVGRNLYHNLGLLMDEMAKNDGYFNIDIKYDALFKFINGNNDHFLEEIKSDQKIEEIDDLIRVTKEYLQTTQKTWGVMEWMEACYPEYFTIPPIHSDNPYEHILTGRHDIVGAIMIRLRDFIKVNYKEFELDLKNSKDNISKFIDASKEIDKVLEKGIKPVNMLDGFTAGWLSPEAVYYGLNGEIANMLHNQMADAMYKEGIIPKNKENKQNPDHWLSLNGWVKQHENRILYDGYDNSKSEIPITKKQINIIVKFGQTCHEGSLKIGITQQHISAAMFGMIEPLQFKMKWFKF